jgi:magnesium transporter
MRRQKKVSQAAGQIPGALIHIGDKKVDKAKVSLIGYNESGINEEKVTDLHSLRSQLKNENNLWLNVDGISDTEAVKKIGDVFNLHPLMLEDIVNTAQRPKFEDYGEYIFIVLKMIYFDNSKNEIHSEQVSLVLGNNYCLSFQEEVGDIFNPIRERLRNKKGRIREAAVDYLLYCLIDSIVDSYFIILEKLGDNIEGMEDELIKKPTSNTLSFIYRLKREAAFLRRSVWPLREVISSLERDESSLVKKSTLVYLRDVYDHTIQVIDTIETFRDMLSGMLDMYLSSISNRMNEVMKTLTIMASIFIPLTFIVGIYGMNFKYMPELDKSWGYPAVLSFMTLIFIGMIIYFKNKKWI